MISLGVLFLILYFCTLLTYSTACFAYVPFKQNLSLGKQVPHFLKTDTMNIFSLYTLINLFVSLIYEHPLALVYFSLFTDFAFPIQNLTLPKSTLILNRFSCLMLSTTIFYFAIGPICQTLSLAVLQISSNSLRNSKSPVWLPILLIILSNDIHLNPGPNFQTNVLNVMSWNVNSSVKDNF